MSEEERPQNDFFTDLMFGSRPRTELPKEESKEEQAINEDSKDEPVTFTPPSQLEQILMIVQFLAPSLEKLAPYLDRVNTFLTQDKKKPTVTQKITKKKNADK